MEPKRTYSFVVKINNVKFDYSPYVRQCHLPTWLVQQGKFVSGGCITFVDTVYPNIAKQLMKDFSNARKIDIIVRYLDLEGNSIETWNMIGTVSSINFGMYSYSDNKVKTCDLGFQIESATLT